MTVAGVVLAAGPSTRFTGPGPKQLLEIDGVALVRRVVAMALESVLDEVVVVVGHRADEIHQALRGLAIRIVENPDYAQGQSTSVKVGLRAVAAQVSAVMFIPADQPGLGASTVNLLLDRYELTKPGIVVPCFHGVRGAPVTFDCSLFEKLLGLEGDVGGRSLFEANEAALVEVELDRPEELSDIDTESDWLAFRARNEPLNRVES